MFARTMRIRKLIRHVLGILGGLILLISVATVTSNSIAQTFSPDVQLRLEIAEEEYTNLRQLIEDFSRLEGFEVQNIGRNLRLQNGGEIFYVVLIRKEEIKLLITDFLEEKGVVFAFYELKPSSDFERIVQDLTDQICESWPGKVSPYSGGS